MDEQPSAAPPGWYAHPSMTDTQAYWDGERWTEHVAPGQLPAERAVADEQDSNQLTFWGLGFAVLLPLVGFVIGCVLLARRATKAGIVVMVLAVGASVFWFNAYTNHQHNKCMDDNIDRAGSGLPLRDCG